MLEQIRKEIAPTGKLRVAINLGNFLLVTGKTSTGEPKGVSPDMAHAIAARLELPVEFVLFDTPGAIADAATDDVWDIGNIGAEPERAKVITFTSAYCEIESTYLLPPDSTLQSIEEVDSKGVRIATYGRAAYGLWLSANIQLAQLVKTEGMDASYDLFVEQGLDALAGLRPRLVEDAKRLPGSRVLDGQFSAVQQAIGTKPERKLSHAFLQEFVDHAKASGLVAKLMARHGVTELLSVAP